MSDLLQETVRRQAALAPERVALVDGDRRATYGELQQGAARIAGMLAGLGAEPGDRIGLLLPKSLEAVLGMLGTLTAGCAYVPLDPTSPVPRLRRILSSCRPKVVLAVSSLVEVASSLSEGHAGRVRFGCLDAPARDPFVFDARDVERAAPAETPSSATPDDAAHILFTSGSTGEPKGVVITHRNVLSFVAWANPYFGMGPSDRNSGHSPLFFDLSTFDLYGTFAAGAELHLVSPRLNLLAHKLAAFIRERRLTQWFSVPSILNYMAKFDVLRQGDFPDLKRVLWCGEVLPTPSLIHWMHRLPHVTFTNLYGPTEATIASSYHTVPSCPADPGAEIPIGRACGGERLQVLTEDLSVAPDETAGDLYISGAGLSPGYWEAPELTARAFLRDPREGARLYRTGDRARRGKDGLLYYLGRADQQIKSRGYRIELGEIEAALQTLPQLREAAVVAIPSDGFEGSRICCAYVFRQGSSIPTPRLRTELSKLLPSYMVPSRWREEKGLPRTPNGKVDRRTLREAFQAENPPEANGR